MTRHPDIRPCPPFSFSAGHQVFGTPSGVAPGGLRRCFRTTLAALACASAVAFGSPALAAPDLVIQSIGVTPTSGANGTSVTISVQVLNQGDTNAPATKTRVRVNQDPTTVDSGDLALCSNLGTPALAAGASASVGCTPTLSGLPIGANYIWAIADADKNSGESDTTNNRTATPFTVNDLAPDLVIQSVVVTPTSTPNGAPITVSVTVKNQGNAASLSSVTRIRVNQDPANAASTDTVLCASLLTPVLAVGATALVQCNPTVTGLPVGTNYVWAIADVNKTAGQIDTTNDRASTPLNITAMASDLVVDSIVLDPVGGPNGAPVTITATIKNQGLATSLASVTRFRINQDPTTVGAVDTALCNAVATPAIAVGASTPVVCTALLTSRPPGPNYIWVIADANGTAGQSDRTNDRTNAPFAVDPPPVPDMKVTRLTAKPTSAAAGDTVTISAKVANDGKVDSIASKTRILINQNADAVSDSDTVLCDQIATVALAPGASVTVGCKPVLPQLLPGPSYLWAVADVTGISGETNADNNALPAAFTVIAAPAPDLVVDAVSALPVSAGSGTSVALTATIRNQGNVAAALSSTQFRLGNSAAAVADTDPVVCDAIATPVLAVGATTNVNCNWGVGAEVPGPYFLWAVADTTGTAGQADRTNDTRSTPFSVKAPGGPDLNLVRVSTRPISARNGDTLLLMARISNVGNAPALASMTTIRINTNPASVGSGDEALCAFLATPALAVGASARVHCRAKLNGRPLGANSVWAIADSTATSGQTNTANDQKRAALTVISSDCTDPSTAPQMNWPVEQPRVLQDYASFGSVPLTAGALGYHSGIDLASQLPIAADETPVYSAADGEVVAVRRNCPSPADVVLNPPNGSCNAGWGNYVVVRHGTGIFSVYAHLGRVFAKNGCVTQGQRLALAGSSGSTTIPVHLHFDVLANLVEPVVRKSFGAEYYRELHPYVGRQPETPAGSPSIHLDPRDFMLRSRVRLTVAAVASRGTATGGVAAYLAKGQEFVSYGELVPGYDCIDLPNPTAPSSGPPYADDARYGWVPTSKLEVLETGLAPTSERIDGYGAFTTQGVGSNFIVMRDQPGDASAEVTKAWGDQQFAPAGAATAEAGSGRLWIPVDVPGTAASGVHRPRQAWLPEDALGPPPAP